MITVTADEVRHQWLPTVAHSSRNMRDEIKSRKKDALAHALEGEEEGLQISQLTAQVLTATVGAVAQAIELLQDMEDDHVVLTLTRVANWSAQETNKKEPQAFFTLDDDTKVRVSWDDNQMDSGSFGCLRQLSYLSARKGETAAQAHIMKAAMVIAIRKWRDQ
jgi:hypothetical protein